METQDLELTISAEEICRTCLAAADRTQLKPIFCNEILDGRIVPFPSVLELVIGEKLVKHEKLPNNVCSECKGKLRDLFLFVGTAQKSNKLLFEIFTVQPSHPVNAKKPDTNHAESQTETLAESTNPVLENVTLSRNVTKSDVGTQCANLTAEMYCQTDAQYVLENMNVENVPHKVIKDDDSDIITPIIVDEEEDKSSHGNELFRESSIECTLMNFGDVVDEEDDDDDDDGENKYEMVLLGDETNADDCFTLRPIKTDRKLQISRPKEIMPSTEPKGSMQRTLPIKPAIDLEQKQVTRQLRGKKAYCSYCNWYGRPAGLEQHFQVHKETFELCLESNDYYRCSNCFTVFISQIHFIEHCSTSCNRIPVEKYAYNSDLNKHETFYLNGLDICVPRLKTFKKIGNKYQCDRCVKHVSNSFDAIRQHLLTHEAEDDKTDDVELLWKSNHLHQIHVCGICKVQFPDATYIRQHLYFHQDSFICIYGCGIIFVSFLQMTRHIESKHLRSRESIRETSTVDDNKAQNESYQCSQCGKMLASAESLRNHMKNHSRRYVCTECNKCFGQKSDLTNHCRIHTDDRPYACKLCDKRFRTNSHVRDHMFTHENVNKYECDVCHKMFKAKRILAAHARLHAGEKPYHCKLCNKCFSRKQHLISHQKTHFKPSSSGTASKSEKPAKRSP